MLIVNTNAWHRKHDDPTQPIVPHPKARYYPNSRQDLIDIVNLALKNYAPGRTLPLPEVRASGSHWALSDAAISGDFFVETQNPEVNPPNFGPPRLNQTLTNVIPGCLTPEASDYLQVMSVKAGKFDPNAVPNDTLFTLLHVEAGTRIYEVYSRLDEDVETPFALQTMGGAGGQTITGAFSTGTHGGDALFPPLADSVVAIHLIAPALFDEDGAGSLKIAKAAEFWLERVDPVPFVDEAKLQAVYPKLPEEGQAITVIRDTNVFNAALVGVGRMGIIYSVVLKAGWQYCLEQVSTADTWNNVKTWINFPSDPHFPQKPSDTEHRFVEVVVNPNSQPHNAGEHSCYPTFNGKRALTSTPPGRDERRGKRIFGSNPPEFENAGIAAPYPPDNSSSLFNIPCSDGSPIKGLVSNLVDEAKAGLVKLIATGGIAVAIGLISADQLAKAVALAIQFIIALEGLYGLVPGGPLGDTVGAICNWCAENDHFEIVREVQEAVMAAQLKPQDTTAISYAVLDSHDYTDIGCKVNVDSLEVFFDASDPQGNTPLLVEYVQNLFNRIGELEDGAAWANNTPQAFVGYISLRFMSRSQGLIAMQQFRHTCAMEIAGFNKVNGTAPFLKQIEADALKAGGTVHWGQRNDLTMADIEKSYGGGPNAPLSVWREALSRFSAGGRLQIFSTDFTRQRGLEIIQPTIESFTVVPAIAPTGTPVKISWQSGDAPGPTLGSVGTIAILTISPVYQAIHLPTVDGTKTIPMPAGTSEFTLSLNYQFNGQLYMASRTVQVKGT